MKLVPLVETQNTEAPVSTGRMCTCGCGMLVADIKGLRPMETEADLIAAAVAPGLVTIRRLFDVLETDISCDGNCMLCKAQRNMTAEGATRYAVHARLTTLVEHGWPREEIPPYDPTLRL